MHLRRAPWAFLALPWRQPCVVVIAAVRNEANAGEKRNDRLRTEERRGRRTVEERDRDRHWNKRQARPEAAAQERTPPRSASEGVFFPAHRAQRNLRTVVSWAPLRRFWSLRRQRACDGTRAPGRPTPSRRARRAGRARFGASADRRRSRPSSLFGDTRLRSARGAPDSRC